MAELEKDWLGRKASDAFTVFDKRKKLISWEKTLDENDALSSYFMKGDNPGKDASKMLGSMFKVIGVNTKTSKYTTKNNHDIRGIKIPMEMIYDNDTKTYTNDLHQIDNFFGAALQRAAFKGMESNSSYQNTLQVINNKGKKNTLMNTLEATLRYESIDTKIAEKLPGYSKFVQKYKKNQFEEKYQKPGEDVSDNVRLMDTIVRMIRFPSTVTEEEVIEFEKPIKTLQNSVKRRGGLPETDQEIKSFTKMLYKLIVNYEDPEEPEPPGEGSSGEGEDDEDSEDPSGGASPFPSTPSKSKEEKVEELEKMAKKLMESMGSSEESSIANDEFEEFEETMKGDPKPNYETDSDVFDSKINFKVSKSNRSTYEDAAKKVDKTKARVLATLFKRKSRDTGFVLKSMKSGKFDTSKIVEASQGVPNVYERMGHVKTDQICIGVLIDESGSMSSHGKIDKAREAAIFINEVFGKMNDVELFIYGHTADESRYSTDIRVYREVGTQMDPFALGSVEARSNNRDGDAIYATAKRIRSKTRRNGIMFVISDGQPAASDYGGKRAIEDVRKKVIKSEKLGFQVIQIAIDSSVPSREMFKSFVKMTDIASLPAEMVRFMSRKMSMIMKEHITF